MTLDEILELTDYVVGEFYDKEKIAAWGGAFFTYKKLKEDNPNHSSSRFCGYKTKEAAVKDILEARFGRDQLGKLCLKLLLKAPKPKPKTKKKVTK